MGNIKFRYTRNQAYPMPGAALAPELSRHHIFSYPFMLTYAVATLHYLANNEDTTTAERAKLNSFYAAKPGGIPRIADFRNENLETAVTDNFNTLVFLCWAEANLFIGPSSAYRADDPSQKMEDMPLSLPKAQAALVQKVKEAWGNVSKSRIVGQEGDMISVNLDEKTMRPFVNSFLDYINYKVGGAANHIYRTKYGDWVVTEENQSGNKAYDFVMKVVGNPRDAGEKKYLFLLREKNQAVDKKQGVSLLGFENQKVWGKGRGPITKEELERTF